MARNVSESQAWLAAEIGIGQRTLASRICQKPDGELPGRAPCPARSDGQPFLAVGFLAVRLRGAFAGFVGLGLRPRPIFLASAERVAV